jgi:hypothetical protein
MSDNVVSLAPALPMVAIIIAAKESGFHPDRIERLVREAYPRASEAEIGEAFVAAGPLARCRQGASVARQRDRAPAASNQQ